MTILDRRTLNRTLLSRQGLLERSEAPAQHVVEHLVGLQAQEPLDPYVALWARIVDLDPEVLSTMLEQRAAVRMGLMRTTLHLVTARDAAALYPVMRDVLVRSFRTSPFAKALGGADVAAIVDAAAAMLAATPASPADLGRRLAERWPDLDGPSMAYAARFLLPLVQVPPRGLWGQSGRTVNTTADAWLGGPLDAEADPDAIVLRYLRAFGPATVADIRTWSWLTALRPIVDHLRPRLRTYRDEAGRELLDTEDGVIADPDQPAPVRLLPQYDNVFLSHADRARINGTRSWGIDFRGAGVVLVDGSISGTWRVRRTTAATTMTVDLAAKVDRSNGAVLEAEAERLLGFIAADATRRAVRMVVSPEAR
jgi:DNA glycosylase AlkZ-like